MWPFPGRPEGRAENHGSFCFEALWEEEHLIFASPGKGLFVIGRFAFMGFLAGVRAKPPGTCPGNNRSLSASSVGDGFGDCGWAGGCACVGTRPGAALFLLLLSGSPPLEGSLSIMQSCEIQLSGRQPQTSPLQGSGVGLAAPL